MDVFLGTILPFGFNYAPLDWATCQGQTVPISQYNALFALLGVTFGGDGQSNFKLPNLQGRLPVGVGQGPAGTLASGDIGGAASVTLTQGNLPNATVNLQVSGNTTGNKTAPSAEYPYLSASGGAAGAATIWSNTLTNPQSVQGLAVEGGNQGFSVINPFLALNFCIAMQGYFPQRP
jgi:microcystin-dependent protein